MSVTIVELTRRVRNHLNDRTPGNPAFSDEAIADALSDALHLLASDDVIGSAWNSSYVSTTANNAESTLTTASYFGILDIRTNDRIELLTRRTPDTIEQMRDGKPNERSRPTDYALIEGATQIVTVRWNPTPDVVYPMDVRFSLVPSGISIGGSAVSVSPLAQSAIQLMAAASLAMSLPRGEAERIGLNPRIADRFDAQAATLMERERMRILGLGMQSDITLREN